MGKKRTYKRDRIGRFASLSGAAARRIERRPTPKRTRTSAGLSIGRIETKRVQFHDVALTVNRRRSLNTADVVRTR